VTARGTTRVEPLRYSEMRNRYVARAIRPLASFRQPVHTTSPVGIARQCRGPSGPVSQSIDHLVLDRNRSQCWVRSKLGHLLVDPLPPPHRMYIAVSALTRREDSVTSERLVLA